MESGSYTISLIIFFVSLVLTTVFSSAKVAFASLLESNHLELKKNRTKSTERVAKLLGQPDTLLLSLKMGDLISSTALVCSGVLLSVSLGNYLAFQFEPILFLMVILVMAILFFINEIWALRFVLRKTVFYAELLSFPIIIFHTLFSPVTGLIFFFINLISTKFNLKHDNSQHEQILAIVEDSEDSELEEEELAMIHSIIEFGDIEVHEIMVPRPDMICIDESIELKDFIPLIKEHGHSRIPLYQDDIDNILGIMHVKDLLPYTIRENTDIPNLKNLARPAHFVPVSKKLDELLKEFQRKKHHMAIVVDEYGGTSGLITLEDLIEEIIGDIQDEYDKEQPLIKKISENIYSVDPKIDLHELNENLEINLPTEGKYDSLGGFILSLTSYVPKVGELVKFENYEFMIEEIERHRIIRVKIKINISEVEKEDIPE